MRQAERRAKTVTALLQAARASFASEGYAGASLDGIAARASLSKDAVYAHFASKLQLFTVVADSVLSEAATRMERVVEALAAGVEVQVASRRYFGDANDAQHVALMDETWRVATSQPEIRERLEAFRRERVAECARAAVDGGARPGDALRSAEIVAALIDARTLHERLELAAG